MSHPDRRQAAETLANIEAHQERARRAAGLPWWVYAGMFVLIAGVSAILDFVDLGGAKLSAIVVLILFVVALIVTFATRSAPLSWVRGVQPRQYFNRAAIFTVSVAAGLIIVLVHNYGGGFDAHLANSVGLHGYQNTVAGVFYGAIFTLLFALGQLVAAASQRPTR